MSWFNDKKHNDQKKGRHRLKLYPKKNKKKTKKQKTSQPLTFLYSKNKLKYITATLENFEYDVIL